METPPFLIDQLAAERGVSANSAKRALYLQGLADRGCTVSEATAALKIASEGVKRIARRFMIDLTDYRPYAKRRDKGEEIAPKSRDIHQGVNGTALFRNQDVA